MADVKPLDADELNEYREMYEDTRGLGAQFIVTIDALHTSLETTEKENERGRKIEAAAMALFAVDALHEGSVRVATAMLALGAVLAEKDA